MKQQHLQKENNKNKKKAKQIKGLVGAQKKKRSLRIAKGLKCYYHETKMSLWISVRLS